MSGTRRIRITGIGVVSPLGPNREITWQRLVAGECALKHLEIEPKDSKLWQPHPAGAPAVMPFDFQQRLREITSDEFVLASCDEPAVALAVAAAQEAIADAMLDLGAADRDRVGCVIGTSKGGVRTFETLSRTGTSSVPWLATPSSGPAVTVSTLHDLRGPLLCPVTACATGLSSLVRGVDLIRHNVCDVVLAGSSDASLTPAVIASFRRLGVLAKGADEPMHAVRPFDRERSGFLVGEGAAVFVLEAEEHALARQRRGYAEWLSDASLSDAVGLTQLSQQPDTLVRLINDTLRRGQLSPRDVDYINLHGTATQPNDWLEVTAIRAAFGSAANELSCSSLKGAIGHLLGAAGSVEFAATLLALRDGLLPPTLNLTSPEFDLDFIPGIARRKSLDVVMKLSLGFGGHLVAAAVRRV